MFYFSLRKKQYRIFPCCAFAAPGSRCGASGARSRGALRGACAHPAPPPLGSLVRAAGAESAERGTARSCPCPSVCLPPRGPKVRAAGCSPRRDPPPRCSVTAQLRRCLSLLLCRKATSRHSRGAGKRQSPRNSFSSPSSPSPASPGSWRRRGSPTASATAPTTA